MEKVAILLTYVTVCGAVKEEMVFVLYRARHAHNTEPVLSAAMFAMFAKAACCLCQHVGHVNHT